MAEAAVAGENRSASRDVGAMLPFVEPPSSVGTLRFLLSVRSNLLEAFPANHFTDLRVSFHRFGRKFICLSDPDDIDIDHVF
jgi:hypothetical protein